MQRLEESWVICNQTFAPGVWGFTIADFWYIIFLTPYNEKVCGIAVLIVFHVDYFAGFCDITVSLNMLDAVFLIFGSIFDLVQPYLPLSFFNCVAVFGSLIHSILIAHAYTSTSFIIGLLFTQLLNIFQWKADVITTAIANNEASFFYSEIIQYAPQG